MQLRRIAVKSHSGGGSAAILASSWASEIVTNGRDQCTIVRLHARPKECNYYDVTSKLLPGLCKLLFFLWRNTTTSTLNSLPGIYASESSE